MGIRSAAKAVVVDREKILLNRCHDEENGDCYTLPGGGQHPYETLAEALVRECLGETGYSVVPIRFAALYKKSATGRNTAPRTLNTRTKYITSFCAAQPEKSPARADIIRPAAYPNPML